METTQDQFFDGERPLFGKHDARIIRTTFGEGESPLKESRDITLRDSTFTWKYPLWYSKHVDVINTIFETMSRSGIWYTDDISLRNCSFQAPKLFRRAHHITLQNDFFADAQETLWSCSDIAIENVNATGDYFAKDSENIYVDHLNLVGNYAFDGCKYVEVHNSTFVTKDAFWNCDHVVIFDSVVSGEYLAWNTNHLTLINCTIASDQGLCYSDDLTLKNCRMMETDLAFEYCTNIDAEVTTPIRSVKNPISGKIRAKAIGTLILDPTKIDPAQTEISTDNQPKVVQA